MERQISKRSNAFTLVELLVTIAIIAIIMAITFPLLARAREMGKRSGCASNLKNLTLAWNMFATDGDGKLCSSGTNYNTESWHTYWACDGPANTYEYNPIGGTEMAIKGTQDEVISFLGGAVYTNESVLWSYLRTLEVYQCPSDASGRIRGYSMAQSMGTRYRMLEQILEATEKIVFIDAKSDFSALARAAALLDPPEHYKRSWLAGAFTGHERLTNNITSRHGGGSNMSFADGHTDFWKWKNPFSDKDKERLIEACKVGRIYE
jgi:prepilin-type N-terminal cleavage/methylation domain-containing protein/prepilin-type processing-associated H-X9-DG protein